MSPHLKCEILKKILALNNFVPEENGIYWVTVEELRDRLVHCGVLPSLTVEHVQCALNHGNRGECLMQHWTYNNKSYYRSILFSCDKGLPKTQRWKPCGKENRLNLFPRKDYFLSNNASAKYFLDVINDILEDVPLEVQTEVKEKKRKRGTVSRQEPTPTPTTTVLTESTPTKKASVQPKTMQIKTAAVQPESTQTVTDVVQQETTPTAADTVQPEPMPAATAAAQPETTPTTAVATANGKKSDCPDKFKWMEFHRQGHFVLERAQHSACCGQELQRVKINTSDKPDADGVREVWKCPACSRDLILRSNDWVSIDAVERGRKYPRTA